MHIYVRVRDSRTRWYGGLFSAFGTLPVGRWPTDQWPTQQYGVPERLMVLAHV